MIYLGNISSALPGVAAVLVALARTPTITYAHLLISISYAHSTAAVQKHVHHVDAGLPALLQLKKHLGLKLRHTGISVRNLNVIPQEHECRLSLACVSIVYDLFTDFKTSVSIRLML